MVENLQLKIYDFTHVDILTKLKNKKQTKKKKR